MPEITDAEFRQFVRYQSLGTPEELEGQRKKVAQLEEDNKTQRDAIRDLKAAVPADGTVAVPKAQAEALAAYEALGKPEDLTATVSRVQSLEAEVAKRDRQAAMTAAAGSLGIEAADLAPFSGADSLTYEVREQEIEGKKVPVAYVKDAEGKEHALAEYGKAQWGRPFETLLGAAAETSRAAGTRYTRETGDKGRQTSETKGGVDEAIERMHAAARAPNPLRPAKAS